MPIQQNQFDQWALELVQEADEITLNALQEMRRITSRWVDDPELRFDDRWDAFTQDNVSRWQDNAPEIMTGILVTAYIRGINVTDRELRLIVENVNPPDNPVSLTQRFSTGRGDPTQAAAQKLSDYPKHLQAFGALQNDALGRIDNTFPSVLRSHQDIFRQVQSEVLTPAFQSGERVARLELGQRMMDRFAQNGITGIRYQNGAQIPIDVYSRMAARSASQNAALQASANRLNERGYDLVRVNQYAGASDLCYPWQGRVYSLSGTSGQYPSMDTASFDGSTGLWHPNCGHSYSAYISGASESIGELSDSEAEQAILNEMGEAEGNRFIYQTRQQQRSIENTIRKYKRKEAAALNKDERSRYKRFVGKWQERQRSLIDENPFLRRRYALEQI